VRRFLPLGLALFLLSCGGGGMNTVDDAVSSTSSASSASSAPLPVTLSAPPAAWSLTGSVSFYTRLYRSSSDVLDFGLFFADEIDESVFDAGNEINTHLIADRIVTAVAADLVTQFFTEGTDPIYVSGSDLVVFRTQDLLPIPQVNLSLGSDADGKPFLFEEVKLWVRDSLYLRPEEVCKKWGTWWSSHDKKPVRLRHLDVLSLCIDHVLMTRRAVGAERQLQDLRQDLSLIAYGTEFVWDGQLAAGDTELRTYDLLLDIAGAGNILGSAPFELLFDRGNQGEQCDSALCPACILPAPDFCGDGGVQGAEQCDDGNRLSGDGCDAFCQVEQNYCGNAQQEPWEFCDEEGLTLGSAASGYECPDGLPCLDYLDCTVGGNTCTGDPATCAAVWEKTCKYSGASCRTDAQCLSSCPYSSPALCRNWVKDSCRFSADGVCAIGDILEGSLCTGQGDCSGISRCENGYCTNHPSLRCDENAPNPDLQCFACRLEEIEGTCYATGETCNGNEDCPISGYCMLEPEGICRPRTRGGRAGNERSICNEFCEDITRCGDRVVYLTESGEVEECDDGMQCADGSQCALGQSCKDGSTCSPRDARPGTMRSCTADCTMQICGDGTFVDQPPEQCDTGATCFDGTDCSLNNIHACEDKGRCRNAAGDTIVCNPLSSPFCPSIGAPDDNPCMQDKSCGARGDDGDGCSGSCQIEYCGDFYIQESAGEQCDDGGLCAGNGLGCRGHNNCPNYAYCLGYPGRSCSIDNDCPRQSRCVPPGGNVCVPQSGDGCDASCQTESACGNGTLNAGEQCDDGNTINGDGCSATCRWEGVGGLCGDGTLSFGEQCDDGNTINGDGCDAGCQVEEGSGICGDGYRDFHEQCDDGNTVDNDGCTASCEQEYCGDLVQQTSEECDDGGRCWDGSACRTRDACPKVDGIAPLCVPEPCDTCDNQCRKVECGNGRVECDEECDDGNTNDSDGCTSTCLLAFCGDGIIQPDLGEVCDDGFGNNDTKPGACRTNCLRAGCGDAVVDPREFCDVPTCPDGTLCTSSYDCGIERCLPRDGQGYCSATCAVEGCGDGTVQPQYGEECDDGNVAGGDGCSSACRMEGTHCGNGVVDPDFGEECDTADLNNGMCAQTGLACSCEDGSTDCSPVAAYCNLGTCNLLTNTCDLGGQVCMRDADCMQSCVNTCTNSCRRKVLPCGDGYRDPLEQCDDGNRANGDGCSFTCQVERPDLCGNGRVDIDFGEECDQGHPYLSVECTPYCRLPHPAPMCGDGRKDPSGNNRGDILSDFLTFARGYQLDWRVPDADQVLRTGTGGWYITPRVFYRKDEAPMTSILAGDAKHTERTLLAGGSCSVCGNGVLDASEQCDSGRLSGGSYANSGANYPEWRRWVWSASFITFGMPYYWNWYSGIYPFGYHSYESLISHWSELRWQHNAYIRYVRGFGGWYWYYADAAWRLYRDNQQFEERSFVQDSCSNACRLLRCGNDRIDDGESCDDVNTDDYGSPQDGDGCSRECFREDGFDFTAPVVCGDDIISAGEQCDVGGQCVRFDGTSTGRYCRFEPGRIFCLPRGVDNLVGSPTTDADNETCRIVEGDGCDLNCQREPLSICGNGVLEPYEECDNGGVCTGNSAMGCTSDSDCLGMGTCPPENGDGCSSECLFEPTQCGNGITEPLGADHIAGTPDDEQCDPPGTSSCSVSCQRTGGTCGDGKAEKGEQCDRGGRNSDTEPNICRTNCLNPFCGDGVIDRHEECDDGNAVAFDGCTHCFVDLCGNGRIDVGETCDDGNRAPGDGCSLWCLQENVCGNAQLDAGEECDDGNVFGGDGCSAECVWEYCGDGVQQPGMGEECDDGNVENNDGCRNTCRLPACGDVDPKSGVPIVDDTILSNGLRYKEVCDPGKHCKNNPSVACVDTFQCPIGPCDTNAGMCVGDATKRCTQDEHCTFAECLVLDTEICNADCTEKPFCGDGSVHGHEECDPPGSGCDDLCHLTAPTLCGNGHKDAGEDCDDGNRANHDGCTETCQFETYACPGSCFLPFVCTDSGEACQLQTANTDCPIGRCVMRAECALSCTFGDCGDGSVDPGEQCDDGRHCSNNPSKQCVTHPECGDHGLCLPTSADGCSSTCRLETVPPHQKAQLTFCQEEIGGQFGQRIGLGQTAIWRDTFLTPEKNPFVRGSRMGSVRSLGTPGGAWWSIDWHWWDPQRLIDFSASRRSWYWVSGLNQWWGGWYGWWLQWHMQCVSGAFPNSIGNLIQSSVGCLQATAQGRTMPNRTRFLPLQPSGISSYGACQEPRAQLVSIVEMPTVPPLVLPPYRPAELVRDVERYICSRSGFPRRFLFLCREVEGVASPFPSQGIASFLSIHPLVGSQLSSAEDMFLSHALAIGYRSGEGVLSQYLDEAFTALTGAIDTALQLFGELQRVEFTDQLCPLDATALCSSGP
jgi:cysteine-rich repeat protein